MTSSVLRWPSGWCLLLEKRLKEKGIWGLVGAGEEWEWSGDRELIFGQIKFELSKLFGISISDKVLSQVSNTHVHTHFIYIDGWVY